MQRVVMIRKNGYLKTEKRSMTSGDEDVTVLRSTENMQEVATEHTRNTRNTERCILLSARMHRECAIETYDFSEYRQLVTTLSNRRYTRGKLAIEIIRASMRYPPL